MCPALFFVFVVLFVCYPSVDIDLCELIALRVPYFSGFYVEAVFKTYVFN